MHTSHSLALFWLFQAVASVDEEKIRLEKESEELAEMEMTPEVETRLADVYER